MGKKKDKNSPTGLVNAIIVWRFLSANSPNCFSKKEIAKELNVSDRSVARYVKNLKPLGVYAKAGRSGGYYYNDKKGAFGTYSSADDVYDLNLSINNKSTITLFNKNNILSGVKLLDNLVFYNDRASNADLKKMIKISEAIKKQFAIKINYIFNNKPGKIYVKPLCFKFYDSVPYLFAYYRDELRSYALPKISFDEDDKNFYLETITFDRDSEQCRKDLERIEKLPDHEMWANDEECIFRVRIFPNAYNRFLKSFKSSIDIDYTLPHNDVEINTKPYFETVSVLLSFGNNIDFIDRDNPVYKLYKDTIDKISNKF